MCNCIIEPCLGELKNNPWNLAKMRSLDTVRDVVEHSLEIEAELAVGCPRYVRSANRRALRNGYYQRTLNSSRGPLIISVPRLRGVALEFKAFGLFDRHSDEFIRLVQDLFALGGSTRKVARFLKKHFSVILSAQGVSNIVSLIDRELERFRSEPITSSCRFLQIDGMTITCNGGSRTALIALGLGEDGTKEALSFRVLRSENKWECVNFLRDLWNRGFPLGDLEMVTHDDSGGIREALDYLLPEVPKQLCIFHKLKNLRDALAGSSRAGRIMRQASDIFRKPDERAAWRAEKALIRAWSRWEGRAIKNFTRQFDRALTYYRVTPSMRVRTRTNNPAERTIREIRRRIDTIGSFSNEKSAERIIYLSLKQAGLIGEKTPQNTIYT